MPVPGSRKNKMLPTSRPKNQMLDHKQLKKYITSGAAHILSILLLSKEQTPINKHIEGLYCFFKQKYMLKTKNTDIKTAERITRLTKNSM